MATRWSSEYSVAEHRDLQASAMAVDWTGVHVLLAGRRYVGLKNLNDHNDILKKFPRQSKYDVGTAEWNPNPPNRDLVAITSNQKVEVLSLNNGDLSMKHLLSWHTRVVTDINWHRFHPELLSSCSIDTFTHIWDLRDTTKPAISFSSVVGASQVCWNRLSPYLLATAHNGDIRLWDQRKGSAPVQYITAHLANIHGLDWSINNENQLVTSSQDGTVKFFDTTNPRRAENIISAPAPVWRARYTPFGDGLVMVLVPPMKRGENSLLLWNLANTSAPVHTFVGHTDVILEFEWRKHKEETSDFQLITWSKDQTLRIWQIDPFLQKLCGHDPEGEISSTTECLNNTAIEEVENEIILGNDSTTLSEESLSETETTLSSPSQRQAIQPKTLQQEFSLINMNIRSITFDKMDIVKRSCTVKAAVNGNIVVLNINFPPSYPYGASPTFQFVQGTSVDNAAKTKLTKVIKHTAQQRVHKNRSCLEPCLRQLVVTLEQLATNEEDKAQQHHHQVSPVSLLDRSTLYTSFQDAFIPFPRTSGAKFCNVGMLVCFCRSTSFRRLPTRPEAHTPRSLSALATYPDPALTISSYYFHDRTNVVQSRSRNVGRGLARSPGRSKGIVVVYDASSLFLLSRELAEKYVFDWRDVPGMCHHNSAVAASIGRKDLVQAWTLAALAATPSTQSISDLDEEFPWGIHPFAKDLIQSLISHYAQHCDIQMAAMLCCAFGSRPEHQDGFKLKVLSKSANITPGGSPYHTIHQVDTSLEGGWNFSILKQNRSNSWSESLDDCRLSNNIVEHFPIDTEANHLLKLDEINTPLYDEYKRAYAEILHRWHLLDARVQVLKYMATVPEPHRGIEINTECQHCRKPGQDAFCTSCGKPCLQCVICHISVRGSANFCLVCGHGGHMTHMQQWFKKENVCPSGCGCHCLIETANVLEL
uniref:RWD domain-containing protein n=1 Tax=Clastoptera arizonana TaxID=38151 RepID=A0A1B6EDS3_9HEMI